MEKLLRSCPEVARVYLLIRGKRGAHIDQRLKDLTDSKVGPAFLFFTFLFFFNSFAFRFGSVLFISSCRVFFCSIIRLIYSLFFLDDFVSFGSVLYFWVPRQVDSSSLVFFFRVFLVFFCSVFCFLFPRFFVFFFSKSSQHVSNPIFPSFQDHLLFFFRIEEFFFPIFRLGNAFEMPFLFMVRAFFRVCLIFSLIF